jgi:poly-gamma-glutamate capsule biosynthesis protein CapA/YwtB (metallophosphatase superfamily)
MLEKQADVMLHDKHFGKFDIVSLANNHINDSLCGGIKSTREYLDKNKILHVGANLSEEDIDIIPIINKKGIKVAFLAYTFSTNGVPLESECQFGTNLIRFNALNPANYDPSLIHKHIKKARSEGADIIVASLHWGIEFEYYPPVRIVERGHALLEKGVDIIIGHHPHILNPSEWYRTADGRDTLCFYSLNGMTSQTLPMTPQNMGQIAGISIEKGKNEKGNSITRIKRAELIPTFFLRKGKGKKSSHRILPLFSTIEKLDKGEKLPYMNLFQKSRLRYANREYKKYFIQKSFHYK